MKLQKSIFVLFKKYAFYTLAFTLLLSPFAYVASVYARPAVYNRYPYGGIYKMSLAKTVDRGQIGMSSARSYDSNILDAYAAVKNTTIGTAELPTSTWPTGLDMRQNNWIGQWNKYVDIMITFQDRQTNSGGITTSSQDSALCAAWNISSPCGVRSTVTINTSKWDGNSVLGYLPMSSAGKKRLIMHETGHANGMLDYCTEDSIMNNGDKDPLTGLPCNPVWNSAKYVPKWTAITGYLSTDRQAIRYIYLGY